MSEWTKFKRLTTDKVNTLVSILDTFDVSDSGSRSSSPLTNNMFEDEEAPKRKMTAIVFVQERQIATALAALLNYVASVKPSLSHLRVSYAVGGTSSNNFKEPGSKLFLEMTERERLRLEKTLDEFRCGMINCLVSTSVLEEGMDITQCNLVVRFDKIQEFRSYVQSKVIY
jgi:ERCC4-related helicase